LQALSTPDLPSTTFLYDPFHRRAAKTVDGTSTRYLYDDNDAVEEQAGTTSHAYLRSLLIDEPLTRDGTEFYLSDALGSVIGLVGNNGVIITSYSYSPFGRLVSTGSMTSNSLVYTGREIEGASLYYYRSRYYHSELERFLSEDPEFSSWFNGTACRSNSGPSPLRYLEMDRGLEALFGLRSYSAAQGVGVNPHLMHLYAYATSNPINRRDPMGLRAAPQAPGCDVVGWWLETINPCARSCCNEHDRCYEHASSWCDQSSWLTSFGGPDMYRPDCVECNRTVVSCILKGNITGGRKECPVPNFPASASP